MLVLKTWGWYLLNTCKWCVAATTTILKSCSLVAMLFQWPSLSETLNVWYNLPYVWWLFLEKIVGKQCKHITIHLVLYRIYVSHPLHFYLHNRPFGETTHPSSSPQRNPTKNVGKSAVATMKKPVRLGVRPSKVIQTPGTSPVKVTGSKTPLSPITEVEKKW